MSSRIILSSLLATLIISSAFVSSTSFADAGSGTSGGGNAVVCKNANQQITSAELLDLYEAKSKGLTLIQSQENQTYLDIALKVAKNIDQGGAGNDFTQVFNVGGSVDVVIQTSGIYNSFNYLQNTVSAIDKSKIILPAGAGLVPINDSNGFILPAHCAIQQLAEYRDANDQLYIVGDIWNHLDSLNKAALLVHEGLYQHLRVDGETSSTQTRTAVGLSFSGYAFQYVLDGIPPGAITCWSDEESPSYRFDVYPGKNGIAVLQFLTLNGNVMLSKTTMELDESESPLAPVPYISGNIRVAQSGPVNDNAKIAYSITQGQNAKPQFLIGTVSSAIDDSVLSKVTCSNSAQ